MQLLFSSHRLRRLAESSALLIDEFGESDARVVMRCLADLRAVKSLEEMRVLPGRCRQVDESFVVSISADGAIVLDAVSPQRQKAASRAGSWRRIETVRVLAITLDFERFTTRPVPTKTRGGVSK